MNSLGPCEVSVQCLKLQYVPAEWESLLAQPRITDRLLLCVCSLVSEFYSGQGRSKVGREPALDNNDVRSDSTFSHFTSDSGSKKRI